jgi:hypothetical protein
MILPNSSCEKCRKITHNFETACMKRALLPYRYHTGLVRHPDQLQEQIPLGVTVGPEAIGQYVAPDDHPYCLVLPKLESPPGILAGLTPAQSHFKIRYQLAVFGEEVQGSVEEHGRGHIHTHMIDFEPYWKMVAKIAYGFAVGEIGLDGFRPVIHDFITGKKPELGAYLIGDCADALPPQQGHHRLAWKFEVTQRRTWISVAVGLFRGHGETPVYSVIVGSATKETVVHRGLA